MTSGGVSYFQPYQDNVSVLHINNAAGSYRVVMGIFSDHSGYLDLYDLNGINTVRLAADGYPVRLAGVPGAVIGPNIPSFHTGTLSILDATAGTGKTVLNIGHNGQGSTSPTSSGVSIRAGIAQGTTDLFQVQSNGGSVLYRVKSSGDEVARSVTLNPGTSSQPACTTSNRGQIWQTFGASGVKDTVQVCAKDASNLYAWRQLY